MPWPQRQRIRTLHGETIRSGWWDRRAILAVNIVLVSLTGWVFIGEWHRSSVNGGEIGRLEEQVIAMENRNFELAKLGQKFSSGWALEKEARVNLGLQKPGESVIIIKDDTRAPLPPSTAQVTAAQASASETISNPRRWWRYYTNNIHSRERSR